MSGTMIDDDLINDLAYRTLCRVLTHLHFAHDDEYITWEEFIDSRNLLHDLINQTARYREL